MGKNDQRRIQWHQGFYSGMELELSEYKDVLTFETEHELSRKPQRIDMLIIKKDKDIPIRNPIGAYFKKHNIIEYKSPDDSMTIDDFYKVIGYVGTYKWLGKAVNEIPAEEITITMVRHSYPREMIRSLKNSGAAIIDMQPGIYRVEGMFHIPTHIIVTSKLSSEHPVLKMLSRSLRQEDLSEFINYTNEFINKGEKELIKSVLEITASVNEKYFEKNKGARNAMGPALQKLWDQYVEDVKSECREEGRTEGRAFILEALVKDGTITVEKAKELEKMCEEAQ